MAAELGLALERRFMVDLGLRRDCSVECWRKEEEGEGARPRGRERRRRR